MTTKRPWTASKWSVGYNGGITGPTTPIIRGEDGEAGPFCQDYLPYEIVTTPYSHPFGDCNAVIAIVPDQDDGRRGANARLIAAAPAMYEALADILDCIDSDGVLRLPGNGNTLQAARTALRAANPDAFDGEGK